MDYLLTWSEGEEVGYKLLSRHQLKGLKIESDKRYSLTELKTGREISDIKGFIEENK
ncbi:hypothetical protein Tfer_0417 [Thermincola ferriacetica]|uniref:Uncharacterized protein n=1 Tax=Thermincola ferriacetica TaxID=281456 RepID=A0A0L6W5S5_9FIRM|nr:hypothetical protein [Thermincola ferriacetica]KNZ70738.1 hypothetical protein Tfer_0417 [Thermincola ferriacetica]